MCEGVGRFWLPREIRVLRVSSGTLEGNSAGFGTDSGVGRGAGRGLAVKPEGQVWERPARRSCGAESEGGRAEPEFRDMAKGSSQTGHFGRAPASWPTPRATAGRAPPPDLATLTLPPSWISCSGKPAMTRMSGGLSSQHDPAMKLWRRASGIPPVLAAPWGTSPSSPGWNHPTPTSAQTIAGRNRNQPPARPPPKE